MFRVLLSGRGRLYIFSQGGLEAGKTAVLLSAGARPPAGVDRRGRRRSGSFGFGSGSFHEAGLSEAFCLVQSKLCAITLRAVLSGRNREGAGALMPGCVFLSSIQTLSGYLYKKHTEISRIQ